ncbi:MAG: hypothetical protein KDA61_00805, partial [Planctomycetales bacterium]|nr:hypothetical protein [Planctomycetales bacterium]
SAQLTHYESRPPLGRLALSSRVMSMKQVFHVLSRQSDTDQTFGQVAVELGYLSELSLSNLLREQESMATPVSQLLVEMGAISQEDLDSERAKIRSNHLTAAFAENAEHVIDQTTISGNVQCLRKI